MRKLLVIQYEAPEGHGYEKKQCDEKRAASGNTKRLRSGNEKFLFSIIHKQKTPSSHFNFLFLVHVNAT